MVLASEPSSIDRKNPGTEQCWLMYLYVTGNSQPSWYFPYNQCTLSEANFGNLAYLSKYKACFCFFWYIDPIALCRLPLV